MITHQHFFPISAGPTLRAWFSAHPGTKLRLVPVGPGFIVLVPFGHQHEEGRIAQ